MLDDLTLRANSYIKLTKYPRKYLKIPLNFAITIEMYVVFMSYL